MRIDNDTINRIDEIDISKNVNQYLSIILQKAEEVEEKKTTNTKNINKDMYKNIRTKASIIGNDQRDIQDRISLIQVQEQKISEIENVLRQAKREYSIALEKGNSEEVSQRIKVRQLTKQVSDMQKDSQDKEQMVQKIEENKNVYTQDNERILEKINDILQRINTTKGKISEYKSKLIELSQELSANKAKINQQAEEMQKHLDDSDYIINGVSINVSEYVDLRGNVASGIIIDIYI